jgi:hypothetical protein
VSGDTSASKSNRLLNEIISNSLFTPRQISIISKRLQGQGRPPNMTSGAYFRQVKQCRDKVTALLYSVVLLQLSGAIQPEALSAIERLSAQLSVIFSHDGGSDVLNKASMDDVISVIDALIKRVSML